jgi:hypothetical protein
MDQVLFQVYRINKKKPIRRLQYDGKVFEQAATCAYQSFGF